MSNGSGLAMGSMLAIVALSLVAACSAGPSSAIASTGLAEAVASSEEAISYTGTYFYFQCNSTAWNASSATLMTATSTPGVFTLTYNVSITYNDNCDLMQTPALDGYGSFQNYFGFTKSQTLITVPSTTTLTALPQSGADNHFNVKYPGTGSFTATFNANTLALTITAGGGGNGGPGNLTSLQHVLLLSVDGLHANDLYNWVAASPRSAIAGLYATGIEYADATATTPSNGFPAMLALATGGTPLSTGVYGDDSYDRTLFPPGGQCQGTPGTEVVYTGAIDSNETVLLGSINTANLPMALNPTTNQCAWVLPHQFLMDNTIFELVKKAGGQTAWADSHPSYEILNGPSGGGVTDLFTPEVNSPIANGGTANGVALGASLSACDGATNSIPSPTDYTTCVPAAMAYDDVKVQAIINQIDGLRSNGSATVPAGTVPELFGMNFEAVGVAQTLSIGGYVDPLAGPGAQVRAALAHVDASVGRIVTELFNKSLTNSTLIVLTAKHGQAPIDSTLLNTLAGGRAGGLTNPDDFVQETVPNVDTVFAPFSNANTGLANVAIGGHLQLGGDVGILWLQTADENTFNISTIVGALSDPDVGPRIGATTPPAGAIFFNSVTSGSELAATFGDPQSSDALAQARSPDMFIQPDLGNLYITDPNRLAGHGGGSFDDTNVPLLISHPQISQTSVFTPVQTTQVAVTILHALRIDPTQLLAVGAEGTAILPNLPF